MAMKGSRGLYQALWGQEEEGGYSKMCVCVTIKLAQPVSVFLPISLCEFSHKELKTSTLDTLLLCHNVIKEYNVM